MLEYFLLVSPPLNKVPIPKISTTPTIINKEIDKILTNIPEIKGYLETRPELIGVAEKPQLIIAGKAHPTGVQKT